MQRNTEEIVATEVLKFGQICELRGHFIVQPVNSHFP